jgi:DNA-directed RNA polymerase subunit beta'
MVLKTDTKFDREKALAYQNELQKIFGSGHVDISDSFESIKIALASPAKIRSWSYGEVKKPETINYRTFKPEKDGLFCSKTFGPIKDYECLCGKYKRMKYRGVICEKCGVEVTLAKVRRERMGHIELASPVAHIWFTKSLPSRIALLLNLSLKDMDRVLYFENYIVIEPGLTPLKVHQLLSEDDFLIAQEEYGEDSFRASIGAEALKEMLIGIDLEEMRDSLRIELKENTSEMKRKKIIKTLRVIESFMQSKCRPEWMILDVVPVIPPELRPLVPLDAGRFATSDLNDLYRRVINRNNRLKRLLDLQAPDIIVRNEKRMLQEAVDALIDNGCRGRVVAGSNKRPLKSLSDSLKGKQGRFRQNLLGKRVDYSGRSVIVVGPELKLNQCGLPKKMALELFKPFVYSRLERYGLASTIKAAKRMVEREHVAVWDILEEVISEHPVLLNRAPTLHRLGIQAFEPILVEGKAIQLHPLVCSAFNADFDGDQMAVHVPLSIEAQLEARVLMMSTNNILSPAHGKPVIVPSKDIVLGIHYLTMEDDRVPGSGMIFADYEEMMRAHQNDGILHLHAPIQIRWRRRRVKTTVGRIILASLIPDNPNIDFETINMNLTVKEISALIDIVYRYCGQKETVKFADDIMTLGFKYSTISGISFGKDDLIIPKNKAVVVGKTDKKVEEFEKQYQEGLITYAEKHNKVIDAWTRCGEEVALEMVECLNAPMKNGQINSVLAITRSGARGSAQQIQQLTGMRGLIAKSSGEIIEWPIISNFKEGLTVLEYFNSSHGARKGLSDTALKTANSGYLTRRLVDVAQDCIVSEVDCDTYKGLKIRSVLQGGTIVSELSERILGRVLCDDVLDKNGKILFPRNSLLDEKDVDLISESGVDEVIVRSPLTCESERDHGICAMCYGRDLGRGKIVNIGESVGVIAAQSIGEPGTQLTLRTFHSGGAAQKGTEQSNVESSVEGKILIKNKNIIIKNDGSRIVMTRSMDVQILDNLGREKEHHRVPFGAKLHVDDGQLVMQGQKLAEWDPYTIPIIVEKSGTINFIDLADGLSMKEITDESTGISNRVVIDWKRQSRGADLKPSIMLKDQKGDSVILDNGLEAKYSLVVDSILSVDNNVQVHPGDIIAKIPKESSKTKDITGGLQRVEELFEARKPKDCAIISEFEGRVEFGKDYKNKRRLIIVENPETMHEYLVPKGRYITVIEGDLVKKGDILVEGNIVLHDILQVMGVEYFAQHLIKEVQDVYRMQGVKINDKHIEIIIKRMLQKIEIIESGSTTYLLGEYIDTREFEQVLEDCKNTAIIPPKGRRLLQGITKASLQTRSFFAAAAFQETTRVLTEAAITGRIDYLEGPKENIIVGRLIPAGTGMAAQKYRKEAIIRDKIRMDDISAKRLVREQRLAKTVVWGA